MAKTALLPITANPSRGVTVQKVFMLRASRGLEELSRILDADALLSATSASTDAEVLLSAVQHPGALRLLIADPLAKAKLLGQVRRKELLEAEGGVLSPEQVGEQLGITRQAVDKRRKTGSLLAIQLGNRFVYPAWQVNGSTTLNHLAEVLEALQAHDDWRKLSFFVNGNVRLGGRSPLATLRSGNLDAVLRAARLLQQQGAA
jgi:hypothetical protein